MNIVIAGCQHETNTFSPIPTTYDDFLQADSWPELLIGNDILSIDHAANIPIAGFIKRAKMFNHTLIPLLWCSATPSGIVTKSAADKITNNFLSMLVNILDPIDAIYLDLHGAMVSEDHDDYEGYLLTEIRKIIGDKIPIIASLDLHANVTPLMVEKSSALIAYQTYPHIDAGKTGEQCAELLNDLLSTKTNLKKAYRRLPYLIPMTAQCTLNEPAKTLYQTIATLNVKSASICMGFPLSDTPHTAPSILCYDTDQNNLNQATEKLYEKLCHAKKKFQLTLLKPDAAVQLAIKLNQEKKHPIILADTQDNPGCGGSCDTTGLLHALIDSNVPSATFVMIADTEIAKQAHECGVGKIFTAHFRDSHNTPQNPITLDCKVIALGDGNMIGSGPFYERCNISLGAMACLQYKGIKIIISSKKMQAADQSILQHLNIDPKQENIIVLKSSVHFRADFSRISKYIYIVEAPGLNTADLKKLPYQKLKQEMRY